MVRKHIQLTVAEGPSEPAATKAPALSAMRRTLAQQFGATVRDLDPRLIDTSAIADRMTGDDDLADIVESIRLFGQRVPILVRPNPDAPGRYVVVYGRRRLAAVRQIEGATVKALVLSEDLDDLSLIRIQGQENSVRRNLSFIERAMFARRLEEQGYDASLVREALNIDKASLSHLRAVTNGAIALDLIETIGPAPSIGRDRWMALARKLEGRSLSLEQVATGNSSDQRFEIANKLAQQATPAAASDLSFKLGKFKSTARNAQLTISAKDQPELFNWLCANPEAAFAALAEAQTLSKKGDG